MRDQVFSAITSKSLASLVIAPRQGNRGVAWSRGLFRENDIAALVTDSLQRLELDFWTPHSPPSPQESRTLLVVGLPPLILTHLRVFATVSDQLLFRVIQAAGSSLEVADVYFETVPGHQGVLDAFLPASSTLRSLRFAANPTCEAVELLKRGPAHDAQPPFDILLSYLRNLEELFVSASEVSQNVFRLLGPAIRHLEIEALNDRSMFSFSPVLVEDLLNTSFHVGLASFTLLDTQALWTVGEVAQIRRACRARGIKFVFVADRKSVV